ncbi:MAG: family 31 glucosidase, partial [Spirochaetes bacterium]|nr:family 31 glucosidase [Spirochaetota bacterium]
LCFAKAFYEGQSSSGQTDILNLVRCAWAGSQKYAALTWSGDIHSSFRAMREQLQAGLNMGLAGIPWWTTDIGGFLGGDIHDPEFQELIIRWFQWGTFCPIMRLHGERPPFEELGELEYKGQVRQMPSGQANEVWSFGDRAYDIMQKYLHLREKLRAYIHTLMAEAHTNGSPVMRTMFFEFPDEQICWNTNDQYMLGSSILVAPVMDKEIERRKVYLPENPETDTWTNLFTGEKYEGGQTIEAVCPLDTIPVFYRGDNPLTDFEH